MISADELRELAAHSLLEHFADLCEGAIIVDAEARIVWMNERYPERLGITDPAAAIGRPIEEAIPHSLMRQVVESGKPIMLDIMEFADEAFVVTRLPLRDQRGEVVGAVGFMLFDDPRHLAPVVSRYQQLRAELADVERRLAAARRTKYTLSSFIGSGVACSDLKQAARRAARTASSVLIVGETGTGKELLAQAIHAASPRADGPFVAVNLAAIPETLLEAEFFGVAAGAYTGADRRGRDGKFKLADRGTLFLDEVGDMSLNLQAKLLRTLQEREVEPVGSNRLIPVDVRVIAATSRDLEKMVSEGAFRADLYYRLNVVTLRPPPLRDRAGDLPQIAECLVEQICHRLDMPVVGLEPGAVQRLLRHDWPGNVRELANVLERALLTVDGDTLEAATLDAVMPMGRQLGASMAGIVAQAERSAIVDALRACHGNKVQAARKLGISRAALYEKISLLGVEAGAV
ncbi:MAG: AAA family ATPase [Betaproteobacteria bacterium]|nr:AAA family ATPase [Betaproteobacteria bacterium]